MTLSANLQRLDEVCHVHGWALRLETDRVDPPRVPHGQTPPPGPSRLSGIRVVELPPDHDHPIQGRTRRERLQTGITVAACHFADDARLDEIAGTVLQALERCGIIDTGDAG